MIRKLKQAIFYYDPSTSTATNTGFLILRFFVGLALCTIFEKFFPRDGVWGPQDWFIQDVATMGFPLPTLFAWLAVGAEFFGGILLMLGLFTRPAALLNAVVTFVAAIVYHKGDIAASGLTAFLFMIMCICITLLGAGKFSLDYLLSRNKIKSLSKALLIISFLTFSSGLIAQTPTTADLLQLEGNWTGNLMYTDFKDDVTQTKLNCDLEVQWKNKKGLFSFTYIEPNGQVYKDKTKIKLMKGGNQLAFDGTFNILNFIKNEENSNWELTIGRSGKDNYKIAEFKLVIILANEKLLITKFVKYKGSKDFFIRNRYSFQRKD